MKRTKYIEKSGKRFHLLCIFVSLLLLHGCVAPGNQELAYFNMLDEQNSSQITQTAEKFQSSIRPLSSLANSHYQLGRYYQDNDKHDKAIQEFTKALGNDSTYCRAYNGIAMSYDALGKCQPATRFYEKGLQCAPDQAYIYNNYGCSRLLCGDIEKGTSLIRKAKKLAEENSRIKNNLQIIRNVIDQAVNVEKITKKT